VPAEIDAVLVEQRLYYAMRASEYDDAYSCRGQHDRGPILNAEWQQDMTRLQLAFDDVPLGGDIVELAAGTGVWTERLVDRARTLTVFDASREMLDVNRARLASSAAKIEYGVIDLFGWRPDRLWDACVFGFWLAKVPDERVDEFLGVVASALRCGGVVCCVDKWADDAPSSEMETRRLNDGREFTIVDHPRTPSRIVDLFAKAGIEVEVQTFGQRFSLTSGTKKPSA
jgi:demethylmenaquinone methyltransferase/2-methoxy-6-polyprenyl-1,4-benzoquinol methylase